MQAWRGVRVVAALVGWAPVAACQSGIVGPVLPVEEFPGASWATSSPAEAGMDAALLDAAVARITSGEVRDIDALVVVRHGRLVLERYFGASHRDDIHTMQSVSKSVTALLVGAAIADGALALDDRVFDVLPASYATLAAGDPPKAAITVRHLLEMRAGIDFHENPYPGSPLDRLNRARGDWVAIALGEPMNAAPGTRWQYNSGGVIVLGALVRAATGEPVQAYAERRLLAPIGVTDARWHASPFDGLAHTGGGLRLRAVDLARIGQLVLHGGRWNGRQILPADWIARSVAPITPAAVRFGAEPLDYGYLWYSAPLQRGAGSEGPRFIAAAGNMTQWLFVVPAHDLVMVVTGRGNASFAAPIDLLRRQVVAAVDS
jgi:CubicO group peptidase (beta-lactamase class C family)